MPVWTLEEVEEDVLLLTMTTGENRITPEVIAEWNRQFDAVEQRDRPGALVVTGTGRFWSTGLDLDLVKGLSSDEQERFMADFDRLLGRIVTAPVVTIAALNGHTYAGGALLSLAFDFRVMRIDRGFFALPSVDVGIAFSPGMSAMITAKIPQPAVHDLVVSCRRVTAVEAHELGVVTMAEPGDRVVPVAIGLASSMTGKDPLTLAAVKRRLYPHAAELLLGGR